MNSRPTTNAMDQQQQQSLWITHVSAVGPYLKVCGQLKPMIDLSQRLQEAVLPSCQVMHSSWSNAQKKQYLSVDCIYLVKMVNRVTKLGEMELLRARMIRLIEMPPPQTVLLVEVDFIDMGYIKIVECEELFIAPQDHQLMAMPPLGSQFILLGIFADWTPMELENILRLFARQSYRINVEMEIQGHKFIKIQWKDWDLSEFLISQRKIGSPINKDFQRDNFLQVLREHQSDIKNNTSNNIATQNNNNNARKHNNNIEYIPKQNINDSQNLKVLRPIGGGGRNVATSRLDEANALKQKVQQEQFLQQQQQRLLQQQMQPIYVRGMLVPNVPRLSRNMTNDFQTYMMGVHQQNIRIPYTGQALASPMIAFNTIQRPIGPTALRLQRPISTSTSPTKGLNPFSPLLNNNVVGNHAKGSSKGLPNTGYKIDKFTVGSSYDVCVSFVEKGPYLFSVQLMCAQHQLTEMMNQIERINLQNLNENLTVGMACIARYSEDGQLYRALIVNAQGNEAHVIYIDYGNSARVKKTDLYDIPAEFLELRAFALPFALAGLKSLGPIDDSMKKTFKEMVVYKTCKLKVTPPEGPPVVQYCELYMQDKNILHVLQEIQKSRLVYPKAAPLTNQDVVEIRFIETPRNFYVQNVANIDEFHELMDDMFYHYNSNQIVPEHIAIGAAYTVKTDTDWYRAEVIRSDEQAIIVRHVDFGYERKVTKNLLSTINEKHLKMPRQAVHCCLKGFENNELNNKDMATTQFEMLAEDSNSSRRPFNVKVFRIQPDDLHIVNLFTKELNVMKKLYKLGMPFEQYLSLEKEDFYMNGGFINNNGDSKRKSNNIKENEHIHTSKTHSTSSSNVGDEQSSQRSRKSGGGGKDIENVVKMVAPPLAQQQTQHQHQQIPLQQHIKSKQVMPNSTPAQRLQQYNSGKFNEHNKSSDWEEKTSTTSSNNTRDARSNASDKQKQRPYQQQNGRNKHHQQQQTHQQQQQQQLQLEQDIRSSSFESTDRRSDASSNSNRSRLARNNNGQRQKERRPNKDDANMQRSSRSEKQQQQQNNERSQNAPQGYSQSRRGSMDSQYGVEISITTVAPIPATVPTKIEYTTLDYAFPQDELPIPTTEEVTICWWISPHQFFTHRKSRSIAFTNLMRDIQSFYKKKPLLQLQLKQGSYVIARHRKDNMFYRARIAACNPMQRKYKVYFVDFGSQYTVTVDDIWPVECRFANFPIMGYYCSLSNIISNYDHLYIIDRMDKYLPSGATITCEYKQRTDSLYYVNIWVNKVSLLERLKADGFVTEISPDISIELLAGQQIRAKIVSIKNLLNFKIIIEGCDVPLLSSYDDVRFVKSNPDIVNKFKQFYEGKYCMLNIKDVNDNKVILLRPVLPLFKAEPVYHICHYPRISYTLKGGVVFISSPHRLFVHLQSIESKICQLLDDMFEYYDEKGSQLSSFDVGEICAAKSKADSNWYRARIVVESESEESSSTTTTNNPTNNIEVYYIDYGNTEILEKSDLKKLEKRFYEGQSAYATEINLPLRLASSKASPKRLEEKSAAVLKVLSKHLEDKTITVNVIECRKNHLMGEVITDKGQNILDILIEKKLVKGRDLSYMCKQLDNDKSNIFEFIETVDLTLDDEDEANGGGSKRQQTTKSQKATTSTTTSTSSRKKKGGSSHNTSSSSTATSCSSSKRGNDDKEKQKEGNKVNESHHDHHQESNVEAKELSIESESIVESEISDIVKIEENDEPVKPVKSVEPVEPVESVESKILDEKIEEIQEEIIDPPESVRISPEPEREPAPIPISTPTEEIITEMEQAVLSHCDTPAQFFVHTHDKVEQLRKLQENLQIVASSFPPLMNVYNGAFCISMYSVDKQWYRAQIIDAELMAIKFIDFGNTDCVSDSSDVKEMSVFPDIEPLCIPCALPIRPNGTADWVDAANSIFNESYSKTLHFNYITNHGHKKPSYINLYIDGVNIAKKLIDDGYAKPLELVDSGVNCFISHVNSINDFYIQYEKDSKALELIEIHLSDAEAFQKITKFEKDKIVAALFHDDGMWYRAKLIQQLSNDDNDIDEAAGGYEVIFIDYGNTAATKECREISDEIAKLPSLSKKCALDLCPIDFHGWSDAAEEKFAEIAASGETIFNVELRSPAADHAIVHLYIDNLNINNELEALCMRRNHNETKLSDLNCSFGAQSSIAAPSIDMSDASKLYNAVISHSISPECFFVQFEKDSARLDDLTKTLNESVGMDKVKEETVQIGELYAAVYDDDSQLYRARVLKINEATKGGEGGEVGEGVKGGEVGEGGESGEVTYNVLFVDFGNEAIVSELRVLPHDLELMREFCKCCALKGFEELYAKPNDATKAIDAFHAIIDLSEGVVKLDFEQPQPEKGAAIVNLYTPCTNESVYEQILIKLQMEEKENVINDKDKEDQSSPSPSTATSSSKECLISHAITPNEFYIQMQNNLSKLESITTSLRQLAMEETGFQKHTAEVKPNELYIVFSEEDNCYYRGKIIARIESDTTCCKYDVKLIDYGNTIQVDEVFQLPEQLPNLRNEKGLASRCRLSDELQLEMSNESLAAECFSNLIDSHFGEIFHYEIVRTNENDENEEIFEIKLKINGNDFGTQLNDAIKTGSVPQVIVEPTLNDSAIVHINSINSFYIHLLEHTMEIEKITDTLLDADEKCPILWNVQIDDLCAAQFPDDGVYYRARIIEIIENGNETENIHPKCLVHFIDFGNDSITEQFRILPEELLQSQIYGIHCALDMKFKDIEAATKAFQSYIDGNYSETFQIEFLKQNDQFTEEATLCRLFHQTKNVANEIQTLLKNA